MEKKDFGIKGFGLRSSYRFWEGRVSEKEVYLIKGIFDFLERKGGARIHYRECRIQNP